MDKIDRLEAYLKMQEAKGRIFTVVFTKKDGTIRNMNCRLFVKKGLKGKGKGYDSLAKRLLTVYDMQKGEYRTVNLQTIRELHINRKEFTIK